ncbi:MAG: ABC transporter ATP-binding protein [Butyricicoccus sp.]
MLKLIHASKIYAKNGICALNAVDLTVQDGDYISVTGASGSGKSTLMHILGLLDSLTDGEYLLDGAAVAHLPAKQRARLRSEKIGFVFQQFRLLTGMTALENVALPLALQGVPRHERSERALAVLERVGLSDRANHRPHQLSGGQQQRVAITGGRDRTVRDSGG